MLPASAFGLASDNSYLDIDFSGHHKKNPSTNCLIAFKSCHEGWSGTASPILEKNIGLAIISDRYLTGLV